MLRKKFSISDNKPKSVILGLFVAVVLLLLFFMIPVFRNDNVINVENNIERSPVKVSLYFDLAEINNKQQGNVESEQSFLKEIKESEEKLGLEYFVAEYEKTLAVYLRSVTVIPAYVNFDYPEKDVCIQYIVISRNYNSLSETSYVESIITDTSGNQTFKLEGALVQEFEQDSCPTSDEPKIFYDKLLGYIPLEALNRSYFYPFDHHKSDLRIWVVLLVYDDSGYEETILLAPELTFNLGYKNWVTSITSVNEWPSNPVSNYSLVHFDIHRNIIFMILTPMIFIVFLIMMLGLIDVDDTGSFLEVAVAILLGLWGIQGILIPNDITSDTIIKPLIFFLYALLAIIIPFRFLLSRFSTNISTIAPISETTISGVRKMIENTSDIVVLRKWLAEESENKRRKTILKLLKNAIDNFQDGLG